MNSYSDTTGILKFTGKPELSAMVKLLFEPFHIIPMLDVEDSCAIRQMDQDDPCTWDQMADDLHQVVTSLIARPDDDAGVADLVKALAVYFHADQEQIDDVLSCIDFEEDRLELTALFDVAMLLNDGHNLSSIRIMTGYTADKPRLFEFGGYVEYADRNISLGIGTHRIIDAMKMMAEGKAEEAFGDLTTHLLESVIDPRLKQSVAAELMRRTREVMDEVQP